jgi:FkbM family methyltransferase
MRRLVKWVALGVLGLVAGAAVLQLFPGGRVFTVRSLVRFERLWARDVPVPAVSGAVRRLEPAWTTLGILEPVRLEVEPGVSLLLDPTDDIARTILVSRTSEWEPEVWAALESGLSAGAVFLDVGAHIGYDSLKAARRVGPSGRVVAFEPNPSTAALLRDNITSSGIENIIVQQIACTDSETTLTFFDSTAGGNSGSSSLAAENAGSADRSFTVKARPIDAVIAELGLSRVDVVKADVEGAELLVLRGATETLRRFKPLVLLEVVPRQLANMGTSVEEVEAFLASLGYDQIQQVDYKNRAYSASVR